MPGNTAERLETSCGHCEKHSETVPDASEACLFPPQKELGYEWTQ